MSRIKVILNPSAGHWSAGQMADQVEGRLRAAGLDCELVQTEYPGHAMELAHEVQRNGQGLVIAAGGDGTVNEVVNGLARGVNVENGDVVGPLGIIPMGTGNDLAEMSGIPLELAAACQRISQGQLQLIDIARVNDRYFDNSCGIGFEAQVAIEVAHLKRLRGYLAYLVAVFRAMWRFPQPAVRVRWDEGEMEQEMLLVSVGNSRRAGGGFYLTPEARLDDGLLDFIYADAMNRLDILRLLPKVMKGTHVTEPTVHMGRTRRLVIESEHPLPVHADGELISEGTHQVKIEVLPSRLRLIA